MEYREIKSSENEIYVAVDAEDVRTEFDTGRTKATLLYYKVLNGDKKIIHEMSLELSEEFINDTYNLTDKMTLESKIRACLDVGVRAYEEKRGIPCKFERVVGLRSNASLRYIPLIDMQSIN